jgi:hypothetical protein
VIRERNTDLAGNIPLSMLSNLSPEVELLYRRGLFLSDLAFFSKE